MERHSETGLKLIKSSQYVEDSVVSNEPEIGPALDETFAAGVAIWMAAQDGSVGRATAPCFSQLLLILKDQLAFSRRRLAKADRAHVANRRRLLEVGAVAKKDNATLYSKVSATRRTFEEHFPEAEGAFVVGGFQAPTSRESTRLLEQTETVLERLKSEDFVLPKPLLKAVKVDSKELIAELEADVEQLDASFAELRRARREVQKSRKNKNRAVREHAQVFLRIARILENLYRMAGEEELAERIRPSGQRPGRRAIEVKEEEAARQASTDASASDQPPDDPSPDDPPATGQLAEGEQPADAPASAEAPAPAGASEPASASEPSESQSPAAGTPS